MEKIVEHVENRALGIINGMEQEQSKNRDKADGIEAVALAVKEAKTDLELQTITLIRPETKIF